MKKWITSGVVALVGYSKALLSAVKRINLGGLLKKLIQINVLVLTTLASIFTVFTGILAFQNVDSFKEWFNREFETEQYWLAAANSLSPEVNVSFFDKRLGNPVYTATHNGLTNRTYVNDYFYTQAMVADDGSVRLFSITIRKNDFHPQIPYLRKASGDPYLLGKTTFGDMSPEGSNSDIASQYIPGFRRTIYSESYYFGNMGNYLYYFLSSNDAGGISKEHAELERSHIKAFTFEDTGLFDDCSSEFLPVPGNLSGKSGPAVEEMRKAKKLMSGSVANTITVTGRSGGVICEYRDFFQEQRIFILGPNLDKVRLFRN